MSFWRLNWVQIVRKGPDVAEHGVVRWWRVGLAKVIQARFDVALAERSVGTVLRRLSFRRLSARPQHSEQDVQAMQAFKKFADLVAASIPDAARGKPIELWVQDEARVGQQGSLTYLWARLTKGSVRRSRMEWQDEGERGSRPAAPRAQRYM